MKNATIARLLTATCFAIVMLCFNTTTLAQDNASKKTAASIKKTFYGQASFYADKFNGRKTASGEIFNQKKMTCACNVVKLGTWLKVTNLSNGKSVVVQVNDRIHPGMKRVVDLSSSAAKKLGYTASGLTRVKVQVLDKRK